MEHLEKLAKVLRYAGLNINPQIISLVLDEATSTLIKNLDAKLKENENLSLADIDAIVAEIQAAQEKAQKGQDASKGKPAQKLDRK